MWYDSNRFKSQVFLCLDGSSEDTRTHKGLLLVTKSELDMYVRSVWVENVWSDEWLNSVQEGKRKTLNTGDMNVVSRGLSHKITKSELDMYVCVMCRVCGRFGRENNAE